jgi:hypothetical protein
MFCYFMLPKVLFNFEWQPSRHRKLPGEESAKVRAASVIYGGYSKDNKKERSTSAVDLSHLNQVYIPTIKGYPRSLF